MVRRDYLTMVVKAREVLRKLREDGWMFVRQRGSHHHYAHPWKPGTVTVSYTQEGDEIPMRTLRSIERQAGWK
jgi:predicted RNA binding protein YcfA (HicA-like mRNA interferase family)